MNKPTNHPPRLADRLLTWFVAPHLLEALQGDLHEDFAYQVGRVGVRRARWRYWWDVLGFVRPYVMKRKPNEYSTPTTTDMLRNYLKIAWRNLARNKVYSAINIGGLAVGMAVAMLIGLWVWDELIYDHHYKNHDRIAQVWQSQTINGEIQTKYNIPGPLEMALRTDYAQYVKHVVMSSWTMSAVMAHGETAVAKEGIYMQEAAPEMLDLTMLSGLENGLKNPNSVLLAASTAQALFGKEDAIGKLVMFNNKHSLKVTGVYADLPTSDSFKTIQFIAPWDHFVANTPWVKEALDSWDNNSFRLYIQIADKATMSEVSAKIRDVKLTRAGPESAVNKPHLFLLPMNDWHLKSRFENGIQAGGRIDNIWLFGIIGAFVLLLACINFMNLSTARAEKRAKEIGVRKSVGSARAQLVGQFLSESFLVTGLAFFVALLLLLTLIPAFNGLTDKQLTFPWDNVYFWVASLFFILFTAILSGSYPALYLSSFQPVKVLKGTFSAGRFTSLPRKALVVLQFAVSVALIIGTMTVFRQIQHTRNRSVGYDRAGLVQIPLNAPDATEKYDFIRREFINSGAIVEMSSAISPTTDTDYGRGNFSWAGKPDGLQDQFGWTSVSVDYVRSLGLKIIAGRDFSRQFPSDSNAILLNKAAVDYMGLKEPIGIVLRHGDEEDPDPPLTVIGVIDNMIAESPYEPVRPSMYGLDDAANYYNLRLNPNQPATENMATIESVYKKNFPNLPFAYQFVDQEYAAKFSAEEQIGKLASVFAVLAIFISCLGLFGLASFIAEQRTKEIGVRKVLGASVLNLWGLLSKDFVVLVVIAFFIATPIAYHFLSDWLQAYTYRTEMSWWIFAVSGAGAMLITLLTVSYQSIKAALMNPVKSLRSE